jgi:hypothetical protein
VDTSKLVDAQDLKPGMVIRSALRSKGGLHHPDRLGSQRYLILDAGEGLGDLSGTDGIGYLSRTPASDPNGFVGWGGAMRFHQFYLERTVELTDADRAQIAAKRQEQES